MEEKKLEDFQKEQAIACFNKTWDYIDMADRSGKDTLEMIHCAHASRYLWGLAGTDIHLERGEWLISKVYALLNRGHEALYHAETCLKICQDANIGDFDLAFAYEAMANAHKALHNDPVKNEFREKAMEAAKYIAKDEDREYAVSEINKI